ncbi:helix-turn-helix transcriptional regulator [Pseudokineococcus lusitanus]|uniref:Helix-turn-helix protein n=1 Tax=Pseudokineococcus lusitanus TaxID=763993 RepID=A0A3N1HK13_9ACTN|nr:hypothetical protein [Pseudokineococcus lusitanus]ROP42791.1 hypothetical protein EDC03_2076 [Pseudokineococcus lusitanus]
MSTTPALLTTKALADRWSCSPASLDTRRWRGDGPPYLKFNRAVRYRLSDVEAYEAAHLVAAPLAAA